MLDRTSEKYASRFTVQTGSRIQIVLAEDVEWIGAAGDYVELHVSGHSHLLREVRWNKSSTRRGFFAPSFPIVQTGSILELR